MSIIGKMKPNNAFTLIEIMLVIIIIGITAAVAFPNFSKNFGRLQIQKTADDLLGLSRWAQAMAIGQKRAYVLSFADDRGSYSLKREIMSDNPDDKGHMEPVNGSLGRPHHVPESIHLGMKLDFSLSDKENANSIEFYPDGTIDKAEIQMQGPSEKIILSTAKVRGMMVKVGDE